MQVVSLIAHIEALASPHRQAPWDCSGIQVAAHRTEINKLAVMLDPVPTTVEAAIKWGAEFILAHHPLALKPSLPSRLDEYHGVLKQTLTKDIWLYSAHTSLDVVSSGPVSWLADSLKLSDRIVIEQEGDDPAYGYGVVGSLPAPMPLEAFTESVLSATGREFLTSCGPAPQEVSRVAICPGSGSSFASRALAAQADVFITGDMKYHDALVAPLRILDVGHFCLEETMMNRWAQMLTEELGPENEPFSCDVRFFAGKEPFSATARNC